MSTAVPDDGARFCSQCGNALGRRHDGGRERAWCERCGFIAYRNPVPVAVVLARDGDRILLVRRANEPLRGFWAPPAGYVEVDESVEDAAVREAREETGLDVALEGLLGVYSGPAAGLVAIAYAGRVVGGRLAPSDEAEEAALFRPRELPPQPVTHAGTPKDIWFLSVVRDLLGALERRPDHDPDEPDRALFREM